MLNPVIGDVLSRITPPSGGSEGYCQSGHVVEVTETHIVVQIQVDLPRMMRFDRVTGLDSLGSFLVRPDYLELVAKR